jgi:inactivated superfamily I helicase
VLLLLSFTRFIVRNQSSALAFKHHSLFCSEGLLMSTTHLIVGAGPTGSATARLLASTGNLVTIAPGLDLDLPNQASLRLPPMQPIANSSLVSPLVHR